MKFKIGSRVIYTSASWGNSLANPLWNGEHSTIGTITKIQNDRGKWVEDDIRVDDIRVDDERWISVNWDNGSHNYYKLMDLQLHKQTYDVMPDDLFTL